VNVPEPAPVAETLAGVRVLEIGSNIAGPMAAMILGDLGADVVKIEDPKTGDDTRTLAPMVGNESTVFRSFNRSKRSVALDLASDAGRAAFLRLAKDVDVVIQNLRPGVVDRLGVGFAEVSAVNPRIIYCSISAFGAGEVGKRLPGYDALVQAFSGIMASTGHPDDDNGPVRVSASLVDVSTGTWAALGVMAAIMRRGEATGPQYVEPCLLDSALTLMAHQVNAYLVAGDIPEPLGSASPSFAPYEAYPGSDGWVFMAAGSDRLFVKLCTVLGVPELARDNRFAAPSARVEHRDLLNKELEPRFRRLPVSAWVEQLSAAGIPACRVNDLAEALKADVSLERRLLVPSTGSGAVRGGDFLRLPVDSGRRPPFRPPPRLGEHTEEVLEEEVGRPDQGRLDARPADMGQ
jgi:crotonobetainyl-CoA:carnitine CoA-transferase CaiB-like acyl-CoA transferase